MPEQSYPPFEAGALTTPRQLQKWLDINRQGGPLKRTRKYIVIPHFFIDGLVWQGYSKIVGEFHYTAPNNFSLKTANLENLFPNEDNRAYTLCISYVNADNTVVRYSLVRHSEDNILFDIPAYEGQMIKKNFRIEIWNTTLDDTTLKNDIQILTSVLGSYDYRYAVDSKLGTNNDLCQGQGFPATGISDAITADSTLITADDINITADEEGGVAAFNIPFVWGQCAQPVLNT